MAYEIGRARKLRKQNIKRLENSIERSSAPSTPLTGYMLVFGKRVLYD